MDTRWSALLKAVQEQKQLQQQKKPKAILIFFHPNIDQTIGENYKNLLKILKTKNIPIYFMNEQAVWTDVKNTLMLNRKQEKENIVKALFTDNNTRNNITKITEIEKIPRQSIHYIGPDVPINQVRQKNKHIAKSHQQILKTIQQLLLQ